MSEQDQMDIVLPKLGESIKEATVLGWLVKPGDFVKKGQAILEVATDKVDSEVPAPETGQILEFLVDEDTVIPIGEVIGKMLITDEVLSEQKSERTAPEEAKAKVETGAPQEVSTPKRRQARQTEEISGKGSFIPGRDNNSFYSPLVRNIAQQYGISYPELARIPAKGTDGRLRKSDIFEYLKEGRPAQFVQPNAASKKNTLQVPDLQFDKGKGRIVEMDRMARVIADHMVFSKHESPHVTAYIEADMHQMVAWRNNHKQSFHEKYGEKLTFTPLLIWGVARALKEFPMINASLDGRNIIVKEEVNIGIGAALPSGNLIVPVIKNADQKDLATLAGEVNRLVERARNNALKADDTQGGTFTISNVGTFGSLMGTPIINQPQAAILATGAIKKRAEVVEYTDGDKIEIRPMMFLCLSFDHRFINGHLAGSFLKRIAENYESFEEEFF